MPEPKTLEGTTWSEELLHEFVYQYVGLNGARRKVLSVPEQDAVLVELDGYGDLRNAPPELRRLLTDPSHLRDSSIEAVLRAAKKIVASHRYAQLVDVEFKIDHEADRFYVDCIGTGSHRVMTTKSAATVRKAVRELRERRLRLLGEWAILGGARELAKD